MQHIAETPPQPERHVSTITKIIGTFLGLFGAVMLLGIVLFSSFGMLAIVAATQPAVSAHATQTLAVSDTPTITFTGDAADVHFVAGASDQVGVVVDKSVHAISRDQAQHALDAMKVGVTQSGNAVTIAESIPNDWGGGFWWLRLGSRAVTVTVTVPATANLAVTAAAGDVTVNGITGQMTLDAAAGNVDFRNVTLTGMSHIKTSAGNMTITGTVADQTQLTLTASAGNITFNGALGNHDAITVNNAAGNVTLHLPSATATHVTASVSAGNISVAGFSLSVNQHGVGASLSGDTAATPSNTIAVQMSAGNFSLQGK